MESSAIMKSTRSRSEMFKNVDLSDHSRRESGSNLTHRLYDITSAFIFKLSLCLHVVVSFLSVKSNIFLLVSVSSVSGVLAPPTALSVKGRLVIIVIYFSCWMVEL